MRPSSTVQLDAPPKSMNLMIGEPLAAKTRFSACGMGGTARSGQRGRPRTHRVACVHMACVHPSDVTRMRKSSVLSPGRKPVGATKEPGGRSGRPIP